MASTLDRDPEKLGNSTEVQRIESIKDTKRERQAIMAEHEEHDIGVWQSLTRYRWASAWCMYAVWSIIMVGFDLQAGGAVLGIPRFRQDFGTPFEGDYVLSAAWQSAFNGAPVASAIIASIAAAELSDVIGRKMVVMLGLLISFGAVAAEFVATTNAVFFIGKFLNGFMAGGVATIMVSYISEISPISLRGIFTCFVGVAYGIGPLTAFIIINYTGQYDSRWAYRAVFASQFGFAAVTAIFVPFMPESPWWLASKGKHDAALRSLNKLGHVGAEGESRLALIELTLEQVKEETAGVTYLECLRKSNLRRTIISIMPLLIQTLSGISFVAGYFTYYLQLAGYSTSMSFRIQIAQPVLSIVGNLMAASAIDFFGRRNLTLYGLIILTAMLLITGGLATGTSMPMIQGTVAFILIYSWWYNVSIGSTAFSLLSEVATSRLRVKTVAIGYSAQQCINLMWQFVIPYLFNPDHANLGAKIAFIFFGTSFLCIIYLFFYQPETAGRSFHELDEMFAKGIPARKFKSYKSDHSGDMNE